MVLYRRGQGGLGAHRLAIIIGLLLLLLILLLFVKQGMEGTLANIGRIFGG